ncbi:MAG: creatininase family protein, partial [Planctomycetota bacterium]|nr:creatininase family protein [Planctomycetota bacterium]
MTPITVYRMHPIDDIFALSCSGVLNGLVLGTFSYFFDNPLTLVTVLRLNLFVFGFYIIGYNLRHSHVWLDYSARLKTVLISPAQHQIHHSSDPKHFDRNFGFMFSFWDRMLGSLYIPEKQEQLNFGLGGEEHEDYRGLFRLYFLPFKKSAQLMTKVAEQSPLKKAAIYLCMALALSYVLYDALVPEPPKAPIQKVHLEQLTWTETHALVKKGYRSIIVPTGGTEQNGPHMVLGKHNYIVRYTSEKIAREIKNTLVAPVIAYVPEGETTPPTQHMKFTGTLSVSEDVFSQLLEQTARSLKVHGFDTIYFIGDSYWNQESQRKVAEKLNKEWANENVRVFHLGDYYGRNGQKEWLQSKGESEGSIGGHAGIRDTSELMIVYPGGLRPDQLELHGGSEFNQSGVHGDPRRASKQRGQKLLQMKIYAACRQIRALKQSRNQEPN